MGKTTRRFFLCGYLIALGFIAVRTDSVDIPDGLACPTGWERIHRGCYKFVITGSPWADARDTCKAERGGDLTSIQSVREKTDLEKHLIDHFPSVQKWWVGFYRRGNRGDDWKWMDETSLMPEVTPWTNARMSKRPGKVCGMLEMSSGSLQVSLTPCTRSQPFICEYHTITHRPAAAVTTFAAESSKVFLTTKAPEPPLPNHQPFRSCEDCPCPNLDDDSSSEDADELNDRLLKRQNYEALQGGDELYRRYLQSEIAANDAKVAYYAEVSKLYEEALVAQSQYYNSYQAKLDLEIVRLREGSKCA